MEHNVLVCVKVSWWFGIHVATGKVRSYDWVQGLGLVILLFFFMSAIVLFLLWTSFSSCSCVVGFFFWILGGFFNIR